MQFLTHHPSASMARASTDLSGDWPFSRDFQESSSSGVFWLCLPATSTAERANTFFSGSTKLENYSLLRDLQECGIDPYLDYSDRFPVPGVGQVQG